jgi:hypothetical protein
VLLIEFSQTFYGPIPAGNFFTTTLESSNNGEGSTTIWSYLSQRNGGGNLFDKNVLLGSVSQTSLTGQSEAASSGALSLGSASFSLTMRMLVHHSSAGTSSFFARLVDPPAVPEGSSTVLLLALACGSLFVIRRCGLAWRSR